MIEPKYYQYPSVMLRFDRFEDVDGDLLCRRTQTTVNKFNKIFATSSVVWNGSTMGWATPATKEDFEAVLRDVLGEVDDD